jgi:hypothetical protein
MIGRDIGVFTRGAAGFKALSTFDDAAPQDGSEVHRLGCYARPVGLVPKLSRNRREKCERDT